MLARDFAISTIFLGDSGSKLISFQSFHDFSLICHDCCQDGRGCEDSIVEHCEDFVVNVDGVCDTEASISSLFLY